MRRPCSVLVLSALLGGCFLLEDPPVGEDGKPLPKPPPIELDEDLCEAQGVPDVLSLAAMPADARSTLRELAQNQVVAVRLAVKGCDIRLEPLPECRLDAGYRRHAGHTEGHRLVADAKALFTSLPLGAARLAKSLTQGRGYLARVSTSGYLVVDPRAPLQRSAFDAPACKGATHVVRTLHLGRLAVLEGPVETMRGYAASADREEKGVQLTLEVKVFDQDGDPSACRRAEERESVTHGCDRAVAVELWTVEGPPPLEVQLIEIPGGPFLHHDEKAGEDREMSLPSFSIDKVEVSAARYAQCVKKGDCSPAEVAAFCTGGVLGKEDHPQNCVTWSQADTFCRAQGQRLPTELEWEKAARGKRGARFAWGKAWPPGRDAANLAGASARRANYSWKSIEGFDDGYVGTAPVDLFEAGHTAFGVLGMGGNVMEWTSDWMKEGRTKVVRGASFGDADPLEIELSHRRGFDPDRPSMHIGFRCAADPGKAPAE